MNCRIFNILSKVLAYLVSQSTHQLLLQRHHVKIDQEANG